MSAVNHRFGVARSVSSLLVVPGKISDDSLKRFSKVYKQGCFPCTTWQHRTFVPSYFVEPPTMRGA